METLEQLTLVANARGAGSDIAEVCGGKARTTQVGIRRKLRCGPNFDLACEYDLTVKRDQRLSLSRHFGALMWALWPHVAS